MGMGLKHGIGNGTGREWKTTSVGMGNTCTPMGIYSHTFLCCVYHIKLLVLALGVATRFSYALCIVYNTKGIMYEAEPDRERF